MDKLVEVSVDKGSGTEASYIDDAESGLLRESLDVRARPMALAVNARSALPLLAEGEENIDRDFDLIAFLNLPSSGLRAPAYVDVRSCDHSIGRELLPILRKRVEVPERDSAARQVLPEARQGGFEFRPR